MSSAERPLVVGIDLGTTFSVVAHLDAQGRAVTVANSEGDLTTPSVAFFDKDGLIIGKEAVKSAEHEPDRVAPYPKRDMGSEFYHLPIRGTYYRPEVLQAAVLRVKLRHLDTWIAERRAHAAAYRGGLSGVTLPREKHFHTYNQFVVRSERRDALQAHLFAAGIATAVYYPAPLHLQPCFASLGYRAGDFPAAEAACRQARALPMYPELPIEARAAVVLRELRATFKAHALRTRANIGQVYICGGTAQLRGLDEQLSKDLGLPVQRLKLPNEAASLIPAQEECAAIQASRA